MKKVLLIANEYTTIVNFRMELLYELVKNYEVFVIVPFHERTEEISNVGCKVINVDVERTGKNPLHDFNYFRQIKAHLKQIKPNIVFTYTIKPNIYGGMACSRLKIPYVSNITGLGNAVEKPGLLQTITLILYKKGLRQSKMVFFQNRENQDFFLKKRIINGKYDLLPGSGVNLKKYSLTPYPSGEQLHLIFVSRVMKEKGIDQFLNAALFFKENNNVKFHIFGKCEPEYENIICDFQKNGLIVYHGMVKDMKPIYDMSSCTIHPTYYPEGMSNVLLESCAVGRPIITTNRSGCKEIVDDGINGFIVKEKDSNDLIDKIQKFLNLTFEEKKQMGLCGRKKVEKQFDRQLVVDKYLEQIKEL